MINGVNYSWSSVKVRLLGALLLGITKISYKEEQEIEGQMGAGDMPVSVGFGEVKFSGELELTAELMDALVEESPSGRVQDLMFPIVVQYMKPDGNFANHTLGPCIIKNNGRDVKAGDKVIRHGANLFIGNIAWK